MRLRLLILAAAALSLFAACRQKGEAPLPEPVQPAQEEPSEEAPPLPDTIATADVSFPAATSNELTLHTDTAVRTDLRYMGRKQKVFYTAAHLYGEWTRGTEHEQYLPDGTGLFWDTGDDVGRNEALRFRWSLDSNVLQMVFKLTMGGVVPKEYLVTFADDESLVYRDDVGDSYMWDKVSDPAADRPTTFTLER